MRKVRTSKKANCLGNPSAREREESATEKKNAVNVSQMSIVRQHNANKDAQAEAQEQSAPCCHCRFIIAQTKQGITAIVQRRSKSPPLKP